MNKNNISAPVLLIVFNRPDTTQQVFDAIKRKRVPKLYVSADAPRKGNKEDSLNCAKVREIVEQVDWDCDIHYRFLDENLGCGYGPATAISWALENEDRVIILEDDCVPAQPFFDYCDYLLEKYKDDERIWLISGRSHHPEYHLFKKYDYIFSLHGHSWGWATWKRCWDDFDIDMKDLALFIEENGFENRFVAIRRQALLFRDMYTKLLNDERLKTHAWDYQAGFSIIKNGGLCIVPSKNLIHNIGIIGTHSSHASSVHSLAKHEEYKLEKEPIFVMVNKDYEELHFRRHIRKIHGKRSIAMRLVRKASKIIRKAFSQAIK